MRLGKGPPERVAQYITAFTGSTAGLVLALVGVLLWAALGPVFHFSELWQLVINTSTTIVTFLMVFLIQRTQNKDALAIQLKLNELVAALQGASNRLVSVEDLSEEELDVLRQHYQKLATLAGSQTDLKESHSVEEATSRHLAKIGKLP